MRTPNQLIEEKRRRHREACARYRRNHPDAVTSSIERFRESHPGRVEEIKAQHYERNHQKHRERMATFYRANRERILAAVLQWQRDNPEKVAARQRRRYARKLGAPVNDLTHAEWIAIQELFDHRCAYCGERFEGKLSQEHLTPLSKGGSHTLSNVVPACTSCNSKKARGPVLCPVQPLLLLANLPSKGTSKISRPGEPPHLAS